MLLSTYTFNGFFQNSYRLVYIGFRNYKGRNEPYGVVAGTDKDETFPHAGLNYGAGTNLGDELNALNEADAPVI